MEVVIVETAAQENTRLKAEVAAAAAALVAAQNDKAMREENAKLTEQRASILAELVIVEGDSRIHRLRELGFSEIDAHAFLPWLAASPGAVATLDHLGALACQRGLSLSGCLRSLIAYAK